MPKYFPLKLSRLKMMQTRPKFIVIHHTQCMYPENSKTKIDTRKIQSNVLDKESFGVKKEADINYHYIIEDIEGDFRVLSYRPMVTFCDYKDLGEQHLPSIHIAVMGNLDLYVPKLRLYEVMAYRLINPLLKYFKLEDKKIIFHSEISSQKDLSCPGMFFEKETLIRNIRRFRMK